MHDVDLVRAEVGHLAAGVIPEPAEMVDAALRVVRPRGRRAEPHVVVEIARRGGVGGRAEARHDVAVGGRADAHDLADVAGLQQLARVLVVQAGALLRAHLHDAVVAARHVGHPAAFPDENGERLLDVDVLAGGAGHHGHQGVPVIGSADDDGLQVLVVEHACGSRNRAWRACPQAATPCSRRGW